MKPNSAPKVPISFNLAKKCHRKSTKTNKKEFSERKVENSANKFKCLLGSLIKRMVDIRDWIRREIAQSRRTSVKPKYITAYDPIIKRRVVHVVVNGWAISIVTGNKFWYG